MTPDSIAESNSSRPSALVLALSDIKLAHSVFAMPFAILAAVMVADWDQPARVAGLLVLVVLCMFFARTWAMLVNRLADHRFDAQNPRTAKRAIASGRLTVRQARLVALASALGFIACCAGFVHFHNWFPLVLSVPVLAWIALYSFTKRFTMLAHLFLGSALAISPIAAVIAVNPGPLFELVGLSGSDAGASSAGIALSVILLSGFVLFWVAGFDVAYALQDIDFDRKAKLHSIPAKLGPRGAQWVSRAFHLIAIAFLLGANFPDDRMGYLFSVATLGVIAILIFEHMVLARRGVAGLPLAFFTLNGIVSILLGVAGCVDVLA